MSASLRDFGRALTTLAALGTLACASRPRSRASGGTEAPSPASNPNVSSFSPAKAYQDAGLIVQGPPLAFVGSVRYLSGHTPDSTLMLVALSLANESLTFSAEEQIQRAAYRVVLDLKQGSNTVKHLELREIVRVSSPKETTRSDESLVFQQFLPVAPGDYTLAITVRDEGSTNAGTQQVQLSVPRFGAGGLSLPVAVYEATPRIQTESVPHLVANPRATVIFGRDSLAAIYVEGYDLPPGARVAVSVQDEEHFVVLRDTVTLARAGALSAAVLHFPVPRIGVGALTVSVAPVGSSAATSTPLFVSLGEQFGIMRLEDLLSYLRYYAAPDRLAPLRDTVPERRAAAWAAFWKATDPIPATPEHEGLHEYFARIQLANQRFREEGSAGWLTDRGKVFITLGEPDQLLEQYPNTNTRGRAQIWEYVKYRARLVFIDQTGFGRWRLTLSSDAEFQRIAASVRGS